MSDALLGFWGEIGCIFLNVRRNKFRETSPSIAPSGHLPFDAPRRCLFYEVLFVIIFCPTRFLYPKRILPFVISKQVLKERRVRNVCAACRRARSLHGKNSDDLIHVNVLTIRGCKLILVNTYKFCKNKYILLTANERSPWSWALGPWPLAAKCEE